MFESYAIGVRVSIIDQMSAPLGILTRRLVKTQEAAIGLQKRVSLIKDLFAGGIGLMGAGATLAAPLVYAVTQAGELQKQLIAVQIATHGTADAMNSMRASIEKVAGVTMFSNIDVAKMAKLIATSNDFTAAQVQSVLPAYAKYADVQLLLKGTPYEQSITDAIRAAHGAQHYDAASLTEYLNLMTKASLIIPGSNSEVVRGLAYFQNVAKTALGISDENSILGVALLNRLGLPGTKGGTNLTAALTRSIPGIFGSGLLTGKSHEALADMQMIDAHGRAKVFDKDGKFSITQWMGLTADFVARQFASHPEAIARQNIMSDFQHAYGTVGARATSALSSPQALKQWQEIAAQWQQYGGFEGMQQQFADESVAQQFRVAKTDFQSAMAEIGITLLPTVSEALKKLNTHLQTFIEWVTKNPDKVREYAENIGKVAVALFAFGAVSTLTSGLLTMYSAMSLVGGGAATLSAKLAAEGLGGALGNAGLLGKFGLLAGAASSLALAFGTGSAVGSLIWYFWQGTDSANKFGESIAKLLAFFGVQSAKDALHASGADWSGSHGTFGRPKLAIAHGSTVGHASMRGPIASTNHVNIPGPITSPNVAMTTRPTFNFTVVNKLDRNGLSTALFDDLGHELGRPQTGGQAFDGTMHLPPAGGLRVD